ncbi:MAG: hypothetical protein Q8M16_03710 [Pirellulaceae bacterium]|nr:hypothetical protein [Pirellulaceae bacterium]
MNADFLALPVPVEWHRTGKSNTIVVALLRVVVKKPVGGKRPPPVPSTVLPPPKPTPTEGNMPENPGIFAHDLRRPSNQCYMSLKGSSTIDHVQFSYFEGGERKISDYSALAITHFYDQSGSGVPWDSFRYLSEDEIRTKCDANHVGCIWVTLEPVLPK